VRISGLLEAMATDPERKEELEELRREAEKSRAELAEAKKQLAELPESARGLVQGQIEKAERQLEMLSGDGRLEAVMELKVIGVNEGPPVDWTPSISPSGG
jgi:F0F1-type ATP synthase membrane subunit b/b'